MISLSYVSAATREISAADVRSILRASQLNNSALGITGLLFVSGRTFFQTLEGPEQCVRALLRRIGADERHAEIAVVDERPVVRRAYANWSMGFRDFGLIDVGRLPGYADLLTRPFDVREFAVDPTHLARIERLGELLYRR